MSGGLVNDSIAYCCYVTPRCTINKIKMLGASGLGALPRHKQMRTQLSVILVLQLNLTISDGLRHLESRWKPLVRDTSRVSNIYRTQSSKPSLWPKDYRGKRREKEARKVKTKSKCSFSWSLVFSISESNCWREEEWERKANRLVLWKWLARICSVQLPVILLATEM